MRTLVVAVALVAAGCSSVKPLPIAGGDLCFNCRRPIGDTKLAGEVIDRQGRAFKFKSTACMTRYLKANAASLENAAAIYVTDYRTGRLITASSATFVPTVLVDGYKRTNDYLAFYVAEAASDAAAREHRPTMKWEQVFQEVSLD